MPQFNVSAVIVEEEIIMRGAVQRDTRCSKRVRKKENERERDEVGEEQRERQRNTG